MSNFIKWLCQFTDSESPAGDLARDVTDDIDEGCLDPEAGAQQLYEHITYVHAAIDAAVDVLREAAQEFGTPIRTNR